MFKLIFSLVSVAYIWWICLLILSVRKPKYNRTFRAPVSVIVPCYNEDYIYLKQCINSIVNANGEKQVILVNNNSNKEETLRAINEYRNHAEVLVLDEKKQGKRFAHSKGLKYVKHDFIVFVDSDTILDKNALIELIVPFQDGKIGGVTGQVKLANRNTNTITKCLNAMFWTSCNIFRRAGSSVGFMQVMPGALSAYRKADLMSIEKSYLTQTFLGRPCSISDDRFLTMRIQTRLSKRIMFTDTAIAYTYMPSTLVGFWKTLERWRRGMIREIFLLWKEPLKKAKLLFFDCQFNFVMFNLVMLLRFSLIFGLVFYFSVSNLLFVLFWIILMNVFWGAYMLVYNPKEFPYKVVYSIFYEIFFVFTYFHALINIRNQGKWVTR